MALTVQAQAFLDALQEQQPTPWHEMSPVEARSAFQELRELFGEGPQVAQIQDRQLPSGTQVRIYRDVASESATSAPLPGVMFFHGGGWVLGNLNTHDALCRRVAKESGCVVVSVDYSLAPEAPFPQPLEECFSATQDIAKHASEFGIRPDRLAVMGDSAGGNLAAAVALKARDAGGPGIAFQLLIYPVIAPNFETSTYREFATGFGLARADMQWFWQQYLGNSAPSELAAPNQASSLENLPPAHVVTAEYDVLRDEGEAYAGQLEAAGVPVSRKRYSGNLHGFIHFSGLFDDGLAATTELAGILRDALN